MMRKHNILLIALAFAGLLAGFYFVFDRISPQSAAFAPADISLSSSVAVEKPIRLIIPDIGVNAAFQYVGLANDGSIGAPQGPFDVAWFTGSPAPGEQGNAIITGHYGPWKSGADSVFDHLSQLKSGDTIEVQTNRGEALQFAVISSEVVGRYDAVPELFKKTDGSYLALITCNGNWISNQKTYDKRLIIFAKKYE